MRKLTAIGLTAAALAGLWWSGVIQKTVRRTFLMTTADPDALGQVASTSMEPVEVTLHTKRPEVVDKTPGNTVRTGRIIDEQITFKAPAAFFSILYFKEGPGGPQEVGFSVWSEKFDPARPDLLQMLRESKPFKPVSPDNPVGKRIRETGERILDFSVQNYSVDQSKQQGGFEQTSRGDKRRPCDRTIDTALSMTVITIPENVSPSESCIGGTTGNAAFFVKSDDSGKIKFVAKCRGDGPKGTPRRNMCRIYSFYRQWPLFIWVRASQPEIWDHTFDKIQKFLESITLKTSSNGS